jgi:hypothetical protein
MPSSLAAAYDRTVSVERLADVAGTNKKAFQTLHASLPCHIQPLDPALSQDIEAGFGKNWLMLCGDADIQEGDRVTTNVGDATGAIAVAYDGVTGAFTVTGVVPGLLEVLDESGAAIWSVAIGSDQDPYEIAAGTLSASAVMTFRMTPETDPPFEYHWKGIPQEYRVVGVERMSFLGNAHLEVTIRLFDSNP